MWKLHIAKGVRLAILLFVLLVTGGILSHNHLLSGVPVSDISLALGAVIMSVFPIFITMGALLSADEEVAA